jgi:hypothetical protein
VSGEARAVNCETTAEWLYKVWPKVCEGYSVSDIFNADETGIFFRLTPDRTLKFKAEKRAGGKLSKDEIAVFVCANSNGTEKSKLFIIGKSKSPRCFCQFGTVPIQNRG